MIPFFYLSVNLHNFFANRPYCIRTPFLNLFFSSNKWASTREENSNSSYLRDFLILSTGAQRLTIATYLIKIHNKYDELCRKTKTKTEPTDKNKYEYLDFLDTLLCDIIYLLQNGDINEHQYKMLDDRITEF